MTTARRRAVQITGGVTLVSLMMFGDWIIEKTHAKSGDAAAERTEIRFIRDSIRHEVQMQQLTYRIDNVIIEIQETNRRLREIVCGNRAGCR